MSINIKKSLIEGSSGENFLALQLKTALLLKNVSINFVEKAI